MKKKKERKKSDMTRRKNRKTSKIYGYEPSQVPHGSKRSLDATNWKEKKNREQEELPIINSIVVD
jgi:hypothetical protein